MMQLDFSKLKGKKMASLDGDDLKAYNKTLAAYMREPMSVEFSRENTARIQAWMSTRGMQAWTDKADFPAADVMYPQGPTVSALPFYDEGYKEFFKMLDFTGSGKGGFQMLYLTNTLALEMIPPGAKANIWNISGDRGYVKFDKYGMGLEWDKTLLEDAEWAQIADILAAFRNAAWNGVAKFHYDLMTYSFDPANPLVKADIDWHAPDPAALANTAETYTANRDAQTINDACQTIALHLADKGYGLTPNSTFVVFTPLELRSRIRKALSLALQPMSGSAPQLDYNIRQVTTLMPRVPTTQARVTDHYYVAFPGALAQSGMRLNLEELTEDNILARSTTQVDWLRFGAAIGDTQQIERCNIA
jgi:hypothetical protein